MKLAILILACLPMYAQLRAGCSPTSLTVQMAETLSVNGLWEYECYAQNIGTTTQTLSVVGFALDFLQLEQVSQADIVNIFTQKQAESGWAKAGRYAGYAGFGAMAATGGAGTLLSANVLRWIGLATYGATQLEKLSASQEPSIANATAGMLTSDQVLAPGAGYQWKVYASNSSTGPISANKKLKLSKGAKPPIAPIGPIILTQPGGTTTHPAESVKPTGYFATSFLPWLTIADLYESQAKD
jgi:hypothetical protein